MTTGLLPTFEDRCRDWYAAGYRRPNRGARWKVYTELFWRYGPQAVVRHASLMRDVLDHAEERARNGKDGCTF